MKKLSTYLNIFIVVAAFIIVYAPYPTVKSCENTGLLALRPVTDSLGILLLLIGWVMFLRSWKQYNLLTRCILMTFFVLASVGLAIFIFEGHVWQPGLCNLPF